MAKKMPKPSMGSPKVSSIDQQLAGHLKRAEAELIEAVKLFSRKTPPDRNRDFLSRLIKAQELVTWIRRDELVLRRGLMRANFKVVKK